MASGSTICCRIKTEGDQMKLSRWKWVLEPKRRRTSVQCRGRNGSSCCDGTSSQIRYGPDIRRMCGSGKIYMVDGHNGLLSFSDVQVAPHRTGVESMPREGLDQS